MRITFERNGLPRCPWEIQEEVELYARDSGRTGKVHFLPGTGWFARLSLRPNDKRMKLFQEGMAPEPPSEDVFFRRPDPEAPGRYLPLDILQMGASGVREFLDKGNTWSGRGEFSSLEEARRLASDFQEQEKFTKKQEAREQNRDMVKDTRRQRLKIPFVPVGIDLRSNEAADGTSVTENQEGKK